MRILQPKARRATKRTRDRIREHGPIFKIKDVDFPPCMGGEQSVLVEAADMWMGWLPLNEVDIAKPLKKST
jgi:hypothetical protein